MLGGLLALAFGLFMVEQLRYQSFIFARLPFAAFGAYGVFQFARGLVEWKYSNTALNEILNQPEYLFIDIPLIEGDLSGLHKVEDALIEHLRERKTITLEGHSVDRPNNIGTICLKGRQADAMFANVHNVLRVFAPTQQLTTFPKPGDAIDTEIGGKRIIMHVSRTR